ncbi:DUF885 domain-containing protein [Paludibaculum fermentans]|uniref:DUF885 domain-containing protein n=1 Tax=Paludibaculum fermentans TaxID=1473598 RepID=A0A7S7NTW6_PALFE|nr:DUF885 domain-containing protein [Paludibaculum fermentans]
MEVPLLLRVLVFGLWSVSVGAVFGADPEFDGNQSALRPAIERYQNDRAALERRYRVESSEARRARFQKFNTEWLARVEAFDFEKLNQESRIDWLLLRNDILRSQRQLEFRAKIDAETAALLPFRAAIVDLEETRQRMEKVDSAKSAATLDAVRKQIEALRKSIEAELKPGVSGIKKTTANRAATAVQTLRRTLEHWYTFYAGYDPVFTWWAADPYKSADKALDGYAVFLREKIVGVKPDDKTTVVGSPIGREALISELQAEMIPYTPEELIALANKEFAWCENEMKRASRAMGFGDDWHQALEKVKTLHVEPGQQPELIRQLALEAETFVEKHDLVTVPPLAKEIWRMEMMTPSRQLVNPFFTGGEVISVSYPTDDMTQEQKLMSMRGNNIHFSRATVFHELIPGHHLQLFMSDRYRPWRQGFNTPFGVEGWALYWEMLLWDMKFQQGPEDRVGALFWRMHRCARIIFSLSFHLEKMTAQECIDFLVERVGHERDNAAGEVRRSFESDDYGPLYQAAYLLGGLQIRALHKELVDSGKMTNRAFHDRILQENSIPIELVRASLTGGALSREFRSSWRFYE